MIWWLLSIFYAISFIYSIAREWRRFRNGIYLLLAIMFCFIALAFTHRNNELLLFLVEFMLFIIAPLSLVILSLGLIGNGVVMVKKEGLKLINLLSAYFGIGILIFMLLIYLAFTIATLSQTLLNFLYLLIMLVLYAGFIFLAFLLYSLIYRALPKNVCCDFIIIHGAGLIRGNQISRLLARRLDKGISVYQKGHQQAKIIVSGGQGEDESVSEAWAMKQYLINQGIKENNIIIEATSISTYENLSFSKKIMDQYQTNYKCIFVTNDYHVFRTSTYARQLKLKAQGVGCRTAMYYLPSAFIREYLAIIYQYWYTFLIIIALWFIFIRIF